VKMLDGSIDIELSVWSAVYVDIEKTASVWLLTYEAVNRLAMPTMPIAHISGKCKVQRVQVVVEVVIALESAKTAMKMPPMTTKAMVP